MAEVNVPPREEPPGGIHQTILSVNIVTPGGMGNFATCSALELRHVVAAEPA